MKRGKTLTAVAGSTRVSKRWGLTVKTNLHGTGQKPTVPPPRGPRWTTIDVALSRPSLNRLPKRGRSNLFRAASLRGAGFFQAQGRQTTSPSPTSLGVMMLEVRCQ